MPTESDPIAQEIEAFRNAYPMLADYERIFDFLRTLEIGHEMAAEVAVQILAIQHQSKTQNQ